VYIKLMKFLRRAWPPLLLVLLLAAGGLAWAKQADILDWAAMRNYQPASTVARLVIDTTMTPYAKRLFYVNRPAVEDKTAFNNHCTDPSEQVAVLGCYTGDRQGIYLYDVTDARLDGIEEVTAAHEMLHQAYDRLNKAERTRINGLLQEYHDIKATQALKDKIASYKLTEPTELLNEMHSIFGTEAPDLSAALEDYYRQYFADRQKVLAFHQQYQSEFDKRRNQIAEFDKRLAELKPQIEANKTDLERREAELKQRRVQLDGYLAANQIETYNAAVPGFNALVAAYRSEITQTNRMVDEFNRVLGERNQLAVQERELEAAIDSSLTPANEQ
jgi:hypothetical protein